MTTTSPLPADLAALKRTSDEIVSNEQRLSTLYAARERMLLKALRSELFTPAAMRNAMGVSRTRYSQLTRKITEAQS